MNKKIWSEDEIVNMLLNDNRAVTRAVVAIYKRQTESEKSIGHTKVTNGIGFNGPDSKYMSYCASYIIRNNISTNPKMYRMLSGEHLMKARDKIIKYKRQLCEIANQVS